MNTYKNLLFFFFMALFISCVSESDLDPPLLDDDVGSTDDGPIEEGPLVGLNVSYEFDYATSKNIDVVLQAPQFLSSAVFDVYTKQQNQDSVLIATATFDANGRFEKRFTLSSRADSLLVFTNYIGLIDNIRLPIENESVTFDYRPYYQRSESTGKEKPKRTAFASRFQADYTFIDTFDFLGVPENLAFADVIQQNLLDDINASLPENVSGGIPVSNPDYLAGKETNLITTGEADIWITFVSEGAGYRNVLGYYTYPLGQEPQTVDDISAHNVIFPNASFLFSGGGLITGDRVYLGRFPPNTVISWFIAANGWTGSGVNDGNGVYYSNPDFNPEATAADRNHMVLLYDEVRELSLLGFEDLRRDLYSDDDFNDVVFYAKANPVNSIQVGNVAPINTANDADGDGINDELDDFPFDPNQAFNNFAPAENSSGKMIFEDLWPFQGDYDFNDLAMDYSFNLIANANNEITKIEATFTVDNIGAALENGYAFSLPIAPSKIQSIEGQVLNADFIQVNANGTELGTLADESVIFVVGNVTNMLNVPINMVITFAEPIGQQELGEVPFNPFLIVDGDRTREIHLPDYEPTSKAGFLGTGDDFSDPSVGRYYKTKTNLPWAMNIYEGFAPPPEAIPITIQYPRFVNWANSGGTQDLDWFKQ
jgi:LruC domain-containing protein